MLFQSSVLIFNFLMSVDDVLQSDIALSTLNTPPGIHKQLILTRVHALNCAQTERTKAPTVNLETF